MGQKSKRQLEELCQSCAERAWRVAFALLRDADDAFDAVQSAFVVAASKATQIPRGDPWPWFSVVVAFEARNLKRRKITSLSRRVEGETLMTQASEEQRPPPSVAAEIKESSAILWKSLDALPKVQREAIVLTAIGGMSHRNAALAMGMKQKTLSSHVYRGMETLKAKLEKQGVREPVQRALAAMPLAIPAMGMDKAIAIWKGSAIAALGTGAAGASGAILGGTMFVKKSAIAAGTVIAIGLGALGGVVVNNAVTESGDSNASSQLDASSNVAAANTASESENADSVHTKRVGLEDNSAEERKSEQEPDQALLSLQKSFQDLKKSNESMQSRVLELEEQNRVLKQELEPFKEDAARHFPTFTFGSGGQLDAVKEERWGDRADASMKVDEAIVERYLYRTRGEQAPRAIGIQLQRNVEKMRLFEYEVLGKLPSHARFNGENMHPVTQANLIAATLYNAEMPLSDAQKKSIDLLGVQYEKDYAGQQERYPAGTLRLTKLLDEMEIKKRFMDGVYAVLTSEQQEQIVPSQYRFKAGLDLHCPTLMLFNTTPVITGSDQNEVFRKVPATLMKRFHLSDQQADAARPYFDAWYSASQPALGPVAPFDARHYSYSQAMAAGRASVGLFRALLDNLELSEESKKAIADEPNALIPRLLAVNIENKNESGG